MSDFKFREVVPDQSRPENWKDITLNTGGTPSTLQDVKVQQRAGGFCYKRPNHHNRFIYWRTNHDVLELVEESLDANLVGNQVRYRFTDSPILDGVSVHETANSVEVLVATVSSVHRLSFKHPDKIPIPQDNDELRMPSVLRDASAADARDPMTYHVINSSCLPHTSASCLTAQGDTVFALALATGSVLLVTLDSLSGAGSSTAHLRCDSIVPRFLSGLTEAFLGRSSEDNVCVSLVLHSIQGELYLFSLSQGGQLRAWSCARAQCLGITDIFDKHQPRVLGAQKHMLRKSVNVHGELVLVAYFCFAQRSHVVVVEPRQDSGIFIYTTVNSIFNFEGHDLVEMVLEPGGGGRLWCVWVTGAGEMAVSHCHVAAGQWSWVTLEPPPPLVLPPNPALDSRQQHLDAIFRPGLFSATHVAKALSINRRGGESGGEGDQSLRQQADQMVEQEIIAEVSQYDLSDEEYMDVANRCWSRLYSCCVQYLLAGAPALSLLPLPGCMLVIRRQGLSLLRPLDPLELAMMHSDPQPDDMETQLLRVLISLDPGEDAFSQLDHALHLNMSLAEPLAEITDKLDIEDVDKFKEPETKRQLMPVISTTLQLLSHWTPLGEEMPPSCHLRGQLGLSVSVATLNQLVNVRLSVVRSVLLLLKLAEGCEPRLWAEAVRVCRQLWLQRWACSEHAALSRFALQEGLTRPAILDSAYVVAHHIWAGSADQCGRWAQSLLDSGEHLLLQQLARMAPSSEWRPLVVQSLLETGQANKAFDLIAIDGADIPYYVQMIRLLEKYNCADLALQLATLAVSEAPPNDASLPLLHSVLFLHHLALGHYEDAYASLEANPSGERRDNCLRDLALSLVDTRQLRLLLQLPFNGMMAKLETLLESRARTREPSDAALYYTALFNLHVHNMNFRKGAAVMMEQGMRAENADAQKQCFAVCFNTLSLVSDQNHAWIVKPTGQQQDTIEVLELKDIRREYHLALARSKLENCSTVTSAEEVISQCVAAGHYKTALRLCHLCRLSYCQPLEALASACVHVQDNDKAWHWLFHNEISDLVAGDANATTISWRLLEHLLFKYEEPGRSELHKAVASKLMSLCYFLPYWLEASYKKRNSAELMRLYLRHGDLSHANNLACELIEAALGCGKERVGLSHVITAHAPAIWLPVNTIDNLLLELSHHKIDSELRRLLDKYVITCNRVSQDKIDSILM